MGAGNYSDNITTARLASHRASGTDPFAHTAGIRSGTVANKVHDKLNPANKNKAGEIVRESVDGQDHPTSRAVAVLFDETGSMAGVPRIFVEKLPQLMAILVKKGYIEHPHVLFGGIGDAACDQTPLQIGQFESGNEMDDALMNINLEGGGGGTVDENGVPTESYELGMFFMSRHTRLDCFNKRGQKGYLFFMGDETPYNTVRKDQVQRIIGVTLEKDIPTSAIFEELCEKFEVFWIIPGNTSHSTNKQVIDKMRTMFGERMIKLDDAANVCETIVSAIGICEGYDIHEIATTLRSAGASASAIAGATQALTAYAGSAAMTKNATATGSLVASGKDTVERL